MVLEDHVLPSAVHHHHQFIHHPLLAEDFRDRLLLRIISSTAMDYLKTWQEYFQTWLRVVPFIALSYMCLTVCVPVYLGIDCTFRPGCGPPCISVLSVPSCVSSTSRCSAPLAYIDDIINLCIQHTTIHNHTVSNKMPCSCSIPG